MIPKVTGINTTSYELNKVQDGLTRILDNFVTNKEILDGVALKQVSIGTTATVVSHKLGRTPLGYIITTKSGFADVFDSARDSKTLTLTASAAVTADLWVY